jgi:lysophospholipase L1-like esterase
VPVFKQNVFYAIREPEFKELPVDSNSIVLFGDSYTQNFEAVEFFKDINIKNRGVNNDGVEGLLSRANDVLKNHPKKIFIQIGINDLLTGVSVDFVVTHTKELISKIQSQSPKTAIYYENIIPTNWDTYKEKKKALPQIIALNRTMKEVCLKSRIDYIDLYSLFYKNYGLNPAYDCGDHLHLNGKGYLILSSALKTKVH